jgi:hypothetical protein
MREDEFGFVEDDDDFDIDEMDDDHCGPGCECEKQALLKLFEGEPLLHAMTQLLMAFGLEPMPADKGPWAEFKRLYPPICKVMLESRAEGSSEDKVRLIASALAMMLVGADEPVAPADLEKWIRRIRNTLVDYKDEG